MSGPEVPLHARLKRIFDDAGCSDTLVDLLAEFDFESSQELADAIVIGMSWSHEAPHGRAGEAGLRDLIDDLRSYRSAGVKGGRLTICDRAANMIERHLTALRPSQGWNADGRCNGCGRVHPTAMHEFAKSLPPETNDG